MCHHKRQPSHEIQEIVFALQSGGSALLLTPGKVPIILVPTADQKIVGSGNEGAVADVQHMRDAGKIISVSVSIAQVDVQISPRRAKTDSNIPSPGKARSVKSPTPGTTITIKSPPHALPPPPPALN